MCQRSSSSSEPNDSPPSSLTQDERILHEAVKQCMFQLCGGDVPFVEFQHCAGCCENDGGAEAVPSLPTAAPAAAPPPLCSLDEWRDKILGAACKDVVSTSSFAQGGKPWDYEIRTLTSLFHRLTSRFQPNKTEKKPKKKNNKTKKDRTLLREEKQQQRKQQQQQQQQLALSTTTTSSLSSSKESLGSTVSLVLTSDLGVQRTVRSANQWAELLVPMLDEVLPRNDDNNHNNNDSVSGGWDCRVHNRSAGFVLAVSPARAAELRLAGKRPCPTCPQWIKGGEKGLWWHQQQQHGVHHASATAFAASTRIVNGIVVYNPRNTRIHVEGLLLSGVEGDEIDATTQTDSLTSMTEKERAFYYAAHGNLVELKQSVQEGHIDPVHDTDSRGASVLLWAAGAGCVDIVRYLIEECGCDVQKPQRQYKRGFAGRTALHWACRNGHLNVVQYLLNHGGAKLLNDATADGTTAIGWAAWQGQLEILEWIHQRFYLHPGNHNQEMFATVNKFGCNALLWAAQGTADDDASCATLTWLVNVANVSLYHTNTNGHGILHKAAQRNRPRVAQWLQTMVLEPHRHNKNGYVREDSGTHKPPSGSATTTKGGRVTVEMLLPLIGPDQEGCTPSDLAGIEGHLQLADQVREIELQILSHLQTHLNMYRWPSEWKKDPCAILSEWGPGCGIGRLWEAHHRQQQEQG